MIKKSMFILALLASFGLGYALNNIILKPTGEKEELKRVTGIGGIFFKCKDPAKVREWYSKHLGLNTNKYGAVFEWYQGADSTKKGFTQWSPFRETTKYFEPSTKDFMINFRVTNLEALVTQLRLEGVTIADSIESYDYGKFVHIIDLEGNKIELWEPVDEVFEQSGIEMGAMTTK